MRSVHQASQNGHDSPSKQNPRNPNTRSDLVQQQITGDFKKAIPEKEDSGDQPELPAGDAKVFVHRQCCEPNVDAVNISNYVKKKKKGEKPDPHLLNRLRCSRGGRDRGAASGGHFSERV